MRQNILLVFCFLIFNSFIFSQTDDEVRRSNGLPSPIVPRASGNPQLGVEIAGTLLISGDGEPAQHPVFQVYIISQSNSYVFGRQKVRNKSMFRIEAVPLNIATLVLEINGVEFVRYPLTMGTASSIRQDISLTWKQIGEAAEKLGVINANSFYDRSTKNQKLFEKAIEEKKNNKNDSAIKSFKQLLEVDEKDFVAWTELGNLFFEKNQKDAQEAYQKALVLKPDFLSALVNYGKLQLILKNYDSSIEILTKALAIDSKSADINHYLGEAFLGIRKGSKAVVYLNEAIKLAPIPKAELHLRLAALYDAAKLKDKAALEYQLFLQKVPDYSEKKKLEKYISENTPK